MANIGDILNHGLEINTLITPIRTKDWRVSLRTSFNTSHNKVLSTGGAIPFAIGGFGPSTIQTVVEEGKSVGFLRGNKAILNEDGTLKEVQQMQDLGRTVPIFYGNMMLNVNYRSWQFTMSGDYQAGSYVHSFDRQFRFSKGLKDDAIPQAALMGKPQKKSWLNFTNYFVEKADFLKIRNIALSYKHTFASGRTPVKAVNIGLNVYNPLSFTAASVDPEATIAGARSQGAVATGGLNYSTYSMPRQYIISIQLNL